METNKINSVNFGTKFRISTGNKESERVLSKKIAETIVDNLSFYGAKIAKVLDDKGGDVIVETSVGAKDIDKHLEELTILKQIIPTLELGAHPINSALESVNSCLKSAAAKLEYHNNIALNFRKPKTKPLTKV